MARIITLGDPMLRERSEAVKNFDEELLNLTREMFGVLATAKGVGLAAVQIGELVRVFVAHVPKDSPRIFVNPEILETSIEQVVIEEGCLSIPGVNEDVKRPAFVKVQAFNEKGRLFTLDADGLLARVVQHELDHLNGVLFIDRIGIRKRERLLEEYEERVRL
jgi:peptide deformylase